MRDRSEKGRVGPAAECHHDAAESIEVVTELGELAVEGAVHVRQSGPSDTNRRLAPTVTSATAASTITAGSAGALMRWAP